MFRLAGGAPIAQALRATTTLLDNPDLCPLANARHFRVGWKFASQSTTPCTGFWATPNRSPAHRIRMRQPRMVSRAGSSSHAWDKSLKSSELQTASVTSGNQNDIATKGQRGSTAVRRDAGTEISAAHEVCCMIRITRAVRVLVLMNYFLFLLLATAHNRACKVPLNSRARNVINNLSRARAEDPMFRDRNSIARTKREFITSKFVLSRFDATGYNFRRAGADRRSATGRARQLTLTLAEFQPMKYSHYRGALQWQARASFSTIDARTRTRIAPVSSVHWPAPSIFLLSCVELAERYVWIKKEKTRWEDLISSWY